MRGSPFNQEIKTKMKENTIAQFDAAIKICRDIYVKKLHDYGPSWRIMRPQSITDQMLIKATRIRTLETTGTSMVGEGILPEFIAIVNYGIMGLIQLNLGFSDTKDLSVDEAIAAYDKEMETTRSLMIAKNHDYNEAWRLMRVTSYTDMILMKLQRTKEIEKNDGHTEISEGIDANYMDMVNYALFAIIKLTRE